VMSAIIDYNTNFLNDFQSTLRLSQLAKQIDNSDISIISNITNVAMYKKISPTRGILQNIVINFDVALLDTIPNQQDQYSATDQKTIYSSLFKYNGATCMLEDDSNGTIRIVKFTQSERVKVKDVGTVNYSTGVISLVNFSLDDYDGSFLKVYAIPEDKDIASTKNIILQVEPSEITINVEALRL